jgi:hypothetical protein
MFIYYFYVFYIFLYFFIFFLYFLIKNMGVYEYFFESTTPAPTMDSVHLISEIRIFV